MDLGSYALNVQQFEGADQFCPALIVNGGETQIIEASAQFSGTGD